MTPSYGHCPERHSPQMHKVPSAPRGQSQVEPPAPDVSPRPGNAQGGTGGLASALVPWGSEGTRALQHVPREVWSRLSVLNKRLDHAPRYVV